MLKLVTRLPVGLSPLPLPLPWPFPYGKLNGNGNNNGNGQRTTVGQYTYDETNKMVLGVNSSGESRVMFTLSRSLPYT